MKVYKIITKENGSLFNQSIYNRYMAVDPSRKFMWLLATCTLPQSSGYGFKYALPGNSEEMDLEDVKWLIPHLPKIIKKELGILK